MINKESSETMKRESAPSKSSTYTTEEVVNIVGEKPSFLYVMLMFGLMSFNMVGTSFDHFGLLFVQLKLLSLSEK